MPVEPNADASAARILHVDDDEANRYAITRTLVRAGFDVVEAADGAAALNKATAVKPDLIILDVRLPDIDGFEVCRRLKSDTSTAGIPVLHLSASFTTSDDRAHGLNTGADGYLIRPVAPGELLATINALLRVRRAEAALVTARDEANAARDEANAARENAETANRLKDDFLATLSHELRTPLTAIVGWASLLRRGGPRLSEKDREEGLSTIERNAKAQAQLIEDLLDVSRIISGKLRLDFQPVQLASVVEGALAAVRPAAEPRRVRMVPDIRDVTLTVSGDAGRLQQVVTNLLTNAIKFTPDDGEISIRLERDGDGMAQIVVRDTGRGIDPQFLPYVFERFRQADATTKRAQGGLGLGLAIVRQLVESHHGSVAAHSDGLGTGATFSVRLPLLGSATSPRLSDASKTVDAPATPNDSATVLISAAVRNGELSLPLKDLSVLVVEDDADCRSLAVHVLRGVGAAVWEATTVAQAIAQLSAKRFDLIVSDIGMPSEDGFDLIRQLRAMPADRGGQTPAAALSAFAQPATRQRMIDSGFQIAITKPVDPSELVDAARKLCGR